MNTFSKQTLLAELIEKYKYLNDNDETAKKVYNKIIESYSKLESHAE